MSNREFYQDTFSQVRSSTEIRWEDYRTMRGRKRNLRRIFTLAAALCGGFLLCFGVLWGLYAWTVCRLNGRMAGD